MELNTIKEAFVQANENEAKDIFEELIRKSVRLELAKKYFYKGKDFSC